MPYVTSTMTGDVQYNVYETLAGGQKRIKERVIIAGGANVADKHVVTKDGSVTNVTEEQAKLLEQNDTFKTHLAGGFVKIHRQKKKDVKDMEKQDKSAPIKPSDFVKKGKKAPKTSKE